MGCQWMRVALSNRGYTFEPTRYVNTRVMLKSLADW